MQMFDTFLIVKSERRSCGAPAGGFGLSLRDGTEQSCVWYDHLREDARWRAIWGPDGRSALNFPQSVHLSTQTSRNKDTTEFVRQFEHAQTSQKLKRKRGKRPYFDGNTSSVFVTVERLN